MRGHNHLKRSAALLVATAATALVVAASAVAEPDYSTTLNGSTTEFKWSNDGTGSGTVVVTPSSIPCDTPGVHSCDQVLIKTEVAGSLTVKTEATSPAAPDVDLRLYKSNEKGEPKGEVASSGSPTATESVATNATAGAYYLAEVDYAIVAPGGTYAGVATLKPRPGATPPGGGTGGGGTGGTGGGTSADQAPAVAIQRFKASQKASKIKGFAGTASDDKGVSKVELALVQGTAKKCKVLTKKGFKKAKGAKCKSPAFGLVAKGTTKWVLKLSKKQRLKKGKYTLFARATDTAGKTSAVAAFKFRAK